MWIVASIVLSVSATFACAPPSAPVVVTEDLERLAAAVDRAMPPARTLEARIVTRHWNQEKGSPPTDVARDKPFLESTYSFRMFGPGRSVLSQPSRNFAHVQANGFHYDVALGERSAFVSRGTYESLPLGLALLFQIDDFDPSGMNEPLAKTLRESVPISWSLDGTVATYSFTSRAEAARIAEIPKEKAGGARPWPRFIQVDLSEPPRVLMVGTDILPAGSPPRPDRWRVEAWQELDGHPMPKTVRRTVAYAFPDGRSGTQTQLVDVSALGAIPASATAPPPAPQGFEVTDDRLKLVFVIGSPDIVFQGKTLRLKQPLWEHPGDRLPELLRDAVER